MANKMMWIDVRGKDKLWVFEFMGDPKHLEEWRADGLEVWPLCNTYPKLIVDLGLRPVWAFFQDLLGFKNPWSKT